MEIQSQLRTVGDAGDHRGIKLPADLKDAVDNWSVKFTGEIECPGEMSLAELCSLPAGELVMNVTCVSSGKTIYEPWKKPARFTGVYLDEILKRVRPTQNARTVLFISKAPGQTGPLSLPHETPLEIELCSSPKQVMLATMIDGRPLAYKNGGPLRSIVDGKGFDDKGRFFYKSLKWLGEIRFLPEPLEECRRGTWEIAGGYSMRGRTGDPQIEPFMARNVPDALPPWLPEAEYREYWRELLSQGDLSSLVCGVLNECISDFTDFDGWNSGLNFAEADWAQGKQACRIRGTKFAPGTFAPSDRPWNLSYANFSLSIFNKCILGDARRERAAKMRGCDCEGARFFDAHLENVDFAGAYLANVKLERASLTNADLRDSVAVHCKVKDADLSGVTAQRADFRGVDLMAAKSVKGMNIAGAKGITLEAASELRERGAVGTPESYDPSLAIHTGYVFDPTLQPPWRPVDTW